MTNNTLYHYSDGEQLPGCRVEGKMCERVAGGSFFVMMK